MNLLRRIESLEAAQRMGMAAATSAAIDALNRRFAAMSDEELEALIAEGDANKCDPEVMERLVRMDNDELCRLILEGKRT